MLTPEQIAALRDRAEEMAQPITEYLLRDIAERVKTAGGLTSTASYQIYRAQTLGLHQEEIKRRLQKILQATEEEIEELLTQSAEVGYKFDLDRIPTADAISFDENITLQQIVSNAVKLTQDDFTNLTQTLGMVDPYGNVQPLQKTYQACMDYAVEKIATGAQDARSAMRDACRNLADYGVRVIEYESGVSRSIEAATRGCVMGGMGLLQEQISQENHDKLGADGWEISAHNASAPDHEPIQGKQYSDAAYAALNNSLTRRIGTLNCGHSASPIILGVSSPQYTPEELEEMRAKNAEGVTVEGKHYTSYDATQKQRQFERAIRKQKNRILVDERLNDTEQLSIDQIRLGRLQDAYKEFNAAANLRDKFDRAAVTGFDTRQAKAAKSTYQQEKKQMQTPSTKPSAPKNEEHFDEIYHSNQEYSTENGTFDLEKAKEDYRTFLTTVPEKYRIYLEQSFEAVEYEEHKLKRAAFGYGRISDKIYYDTTKKYFWELNFEIANTHELAHRIDETLGYDSEMRSLRKAILAAKKTIMENPQKFVNFSVEKDSDGAVTDIFDAISGSEIQFKVFHGKTYWKKKGHKEKETFANLVTLHAINDTEKLDFVRENFPGIMTAYEKIGIFKEE